jgi:hypothetical protein
LSGRVVFAFLPEEVVAVQHLFELAFEVADFGVELALSFYGGKVTPECLRLGAYLFELG